MQTINKPSKAGVYSIIFGVVSLLAPVLSIFGLILRVLSWERIISFEGNIGFGGISGGLGLVIGVGLGLIALMLGFVAISKTRRHVPLVGGMKAAVAGIILGGASALLPALLFIPIAMTFRI